MATNVPSVEFTPTGLVLPQESDILAGVQADMNAAFGGSLNLALNTPQGQLASSQAAIIAATNDLFAQFVGQVDPDTADGFMQDAIARLYFLTRNPGAPTAVQCLCNGLAGTVIPVGAQVRDTSNNTYIATQGGTIPASGLLTLPFVCTVNGPTACPANSVTKIYQAITGWDTVTNPTPGVPGTLVETRAEFAYRRAQSVAANAHGSLASIYGAVFNVAGVLDVYVAENSTNATVAVGSSLVPLLPHSLYVAAVGGTPADVAQAIWSKKNEGSDYNGNTSVVVTDTSGYELPYPTYTVKYQIPASLPILFSVQLAANAALPSNIIQLVQNAIIGAFAGSDGGSRARIGSLLLASRYYAPVSAISPSVSILSILLGSVSPTLNSLQVGIDQAPVVTAANIAVTLV